MNLCNWLQMALTLWIQSTKLTKSVSTVERKSRNIFGLVGKCWGSGETRTREVVSRGLYWLLYRFVCSKHRYMIHWQLSCKIVAGIAVEKQWIFHGDQLAGGDESPGRIAGVSWSKYCWDVRVKEQVRVPAEQEIVGWPYPNWYSPTSFCRPRNRWKKATIVVALRTC